MMKKPTLPQINRLRLLSEDPMTANQDYEYLPFERLIFERLITKGLIFLNVNWIEIAPEGRKALEDAS